MGRRGGPRAGVTASALGVCLTLAAGCGGPGGPGTATRPPAVTSAPPAASAPSAPSSPVTPTGSPVPSATSDAELCARIVAHGARQVLDDGGYGDYQSMGLSNGQYEIVRRVVTAARAVERRQGPSAADELIDREARSACAERYRAGTPSEGPWQ